MKKLIKILIIAGAAITVLLVAAAVTLKVLFPPERIKSMAMPHIEKAVGREVVLKKAGITLLTGVGVKLKGLEIANSNKKGFSKDPFVKLGAFTLKLSPTSIFGTRVNISKVILEEPDILIEVDEKGTFNIDDLAFMEETEEEEKAAAKEEEEGPVLPLPVSLKKFAIKNGRITYSDLQSGIKLVLGNVNQEVNISVDKDLKDVRSSGAMKIRKISFQSKDLPTKFKGITLTLAHDLVTDLMAGNLEVKDLRLSLQKIYVRASGTLKDFNNTPHLDVMVNSDKLYIKDLLAEVRGLVPELKKLKAEGDLQLTAWVKGKAGGKYSPNISGSIKINNVQAQYQDLPKSLNSFNADASFTDNSLDIKKLDLKLGDNPVSLKGTVNDFDDPDVDLALNAKVDLSEIKDLAELPEGMKLGGKVTADIKAKGKVDPNRLTKLNAKGKVDLAGVSFISPPLTKAAKLNGSVTLTPGQIKQQAQVSIGKSGVKLRSTVTNYLSLILEDKKKKFPRTRATVSVSSSLVDLDEFLALTEDTEEETKEALPEKGESKGELILTDPLPPVDVNASIKLNKVIFKKIAATNLNSKGTLKRDILNLDTKASLYTGRIVSKFYMDARNHKRVRFKNTFNTERIEVNDFISQFNDLLPGRNPLYRQLKKADNVLWGKVTLTSNLSGSGARSDDLINNLTGNIVAKVHDGKITQAKMLKSVAKVTEKFYKLDDIRFKELDADLAVAQGKVIVEKLVINSVDGDWDVTGNVGLDGALNLNLADRLNKKISGRIAAVQGQGKTALKGLLKGTQLEKASGIVDGAGIPVDDEGRVTLVLGLGGTVSKPKPALKGFGGKGSLAGSATDQVKQAVTKKLESEARKRLDAEREKHEAALRKQADDAKAKLDAERKKREEELKKKAAAEKKKLEEAANKKKEDLKKKATDRLKKLF